MDPTTTPTPTSSTTVAPGPSSTVQVDGSQFAAVMVALALILAVVGAHLVSSWGKR